MEAIIIQMALVQAYKEAKEEALAAYNEIRSHDTETHRNYYGADYAYAEVICWYEENILADLDNLLEMAEEISY